MDDWEGNDTDNPQEDKFKKGIEEEKVCQLGKNSLWWWWLLLYDVTLVRAKPSFLLLQVTFWEAGVLFLPSACLFVLPLSFY